MCVQLALRWSSCTNVGSVGSLHGKLSTMPGKGCKPGLSLTGEGGRDRGSEGGDVRGEGVGAGSVGVIVLSTADQ